MLSVETLMKRELVSIADAKTSVAEVARLMEKAHVGAVLLLKGEQLAGIFSERDLLLRVIAEGRDPANTPVGTVATRPVVSVPLDASLRQCAETLRDRGIRHLPVIAEGKPVGMLSARDFFDAVASGLENLIERMRYEEALRGNVDPYDHIGGGYGR